MELITTAGMLTAEEAKEWGLVNHVCSQDELIPTCEKIASKIARNSSIAIGYAIKAVNAGFSSTGYQAEIDAFGACFGTNDFKEGTTAFIEKRTPKFEDK